MLKKSTNYLNLASIIILAYLAFIPLQPKNIHIQDKLNNNFNMLNAYTHVKAISKAPHYIGSENHRTVQSYIIRELQNLKLQVTIQKTNISNEHNTYSRVENIIAKINGSDPSRKSLVLMSHYDSVDFSSFGAADDASGVAVLLEGLRVYLADGKQPINDIVILITDAEEEGLLGAKAFVNKHPWAEKIGAVLNFEARGSSGSSYMLMETNGGNHNLLNTYTDAQISYPSSNSLAYSIYKLLPNDTDLSVFRKDKNIIGYNFAFIDSHFNYHTALDNSNNLSINSLAHQAYYLMPMLNKLSEIDLNTLHSDEDDVYYQIPFYKTISYSFDSTLTFSLINLLVFIIAIFLGIKNKSLRVKSTITASFPLLKALIVTALLCFILLKFLYWLHPHYTEILQGFTYNGYSYILLFTLITVAVCFFFYRKLTETHNANELMVIPVFIWILITFLSVAYLKGAHFFILISAMGTLSLLINVIFKKVQSSLTLLLFAPVILIFSPSFMQLPVALGLAILPVSNILLVLFFSPFINSIQIPKQFHISKWIFLSAIIGSFIFAEMHASFNPQRPLPDSLYYFQDDESKTAYWMSIDNKTDDWNTSFFKGNQLDQKQQNAFHKQHYSWAKHLASTDYKGIPSAHIETLIDRIYTDRHVYQLKITPQRSVNLLNLINNNSIHLLKLSINKQIIYQGKAKLVSEKSRLAKIYNNIEAYFIIDIEIATSEVLDLHVIEISPDLLTSKEFKIPNRPKEYIAKPFVLSDSIITKKRFKGAINN